MRAAVQRTARPEVVGGIGGFAGLFDVSALARMRRPLLATSTDGVGTKVVIAQRLGVYDTIGIDLVGMVVDDLVVCRRRAAVHDRLRRLRRGHARSGSRRSSAAIAAGCVQAGCALIGGETAEHPGHLGPDDFDLAGAATGVVEADQAAGAGAGAAGRRRHRDGRSSGLHSNGFSLVRRIIDARPRAGPGCRPGGPGPAARRGTARSRPGSTPATAWPWPRGTEVHAFAHVTGGGLAANLARVLPPHADAVLDRGTWRAGPGLRLAGPPRPRARAADMERVFNHGRRDGRHRGRRAGRRPGAGRLLAARDMPPGPPAR